MKYDAEAILLAALALAAWIGWRILRSQSAEAPPPAPRPGSGAPPGAVIIPLGQYAVAPARQWLLTQPGG
jgi:hypothetical protein